MQNKKIRVLQLGSPTGLYGAERWILALVHHFDPTEIDSIVSVIRDDPLLTASLCQEAQAVGLHTHVFEAYGRINWSAILQLRRFLLSNNIQILHTHGYKTDIIGLLASWRTPCRLISTPHGWSVRAGVKLKIYETLDRLIFRFFDAIVPLSDAIFDELKRWPGLKSKLHIIRNGVDLVEIDAENYLAPEISIWKERGYFIVGYIGQLIARKGLKILLEAFAKLETPLKKLIILGDGDQRQDLERLAVALRIQEDVLFLGFRKDRLNFLKGFDVFVLPSSLEGIPRCLMEAMAAQISVVASKIPGCTELIHHEKTGLLFELDDVNSLLECLNRCLNLNLRMQLGQNGKNFIVAHYSATFMAKQYQSLYKKVLKVSVRLKHEQ